MIQLKISRLVTLLLVSMAMAASHGIIIRHDRGPAAYEVRSSDYPSVFFLERQEYRKVCVATVIHARWAITAAHCADETTLASTLRQGRQFAVLVGNSPRVVDRLVVHPRYNPNSPTDVDLALIRFVNASSTPLPMPLQIEQNELGQVLNLLGWGFFGLGTTGRQYDDGRLRLAQNRVTVADGRLRVVFDDPRDTRDKALPLEGTPGLGDSGGPALMETSAGFSLAGIAVGELEGADFSEETQGKYGSIAVYERISQHINWIESVVSGQGS